MKAVDITKSTILATELRAASGFFARLIGLIGMARLEAGEGLWMARCRAIHTFWVRFPIDVVFLDGNLVVKKIVKDVRPFFPIICCWSAKGILELPVGTIEIAQVQVGDRIELTS